MRWFVMVLLFAFSDVTHADDVFLIPFVAIHAEDFVNFRGMQSSRFSIVGGAWSGKQVALILIRADSSKGDNEIRRSIILSFDDADRSATVAKFLGDKGSPGMQIDVNITKPNQTMFNSKDIKMRLN